MTMIVREMCRRNTVLHLASRLRGTIPDFVRPSLGAGAGATVDKSRNDGDHWILSHITNPRGNVDVKLYQW
jgi:hypothetical protein